GNMHRLLRHVSQEALESHHARGAAEDVVANLSFDVDHQLLEHLERLGLILDKRIALAIRPQADAVAQAVHPVKVLLPKLVDGAENRNPLDGLEGLRILEADLELVSLFNAANNKLGNRVLRAAEAIKNRTFRRILGSGVRRLQNLL